MVLPSGGSLPMLRKIEGTRGLAIQETMGFTRGEGMRGEGAVVTGGWHDGDAPAMGGAEVGARRHGDSRSDAAHAQRRRAHTRQTRAEVRIIGDSSPFHMHTHTHTSPLRRINGDTSPLLRVTATLNQGARARGRQWQERGGGDRRGTICGKNIKVSFAEYKGLFCRIYRALLLEIQCSFAEYVGVFCGTCRALLRNAQSSPYPHPGGH